MEYFGKELIRNVEKMGYGMRSRGVLGEVLEVIGVNY